MLGELGREGVDTVGGGGPRRRAHRDDRGAVGGRGPGHPHRAGCRRFADRRGRAAALLGGPGMSTSSSYFLLARLAGAGAGRACSPPPARPGPARRWTPTGTRRAGGGMSACGRCSRRRTCCCPMRRRRCGWRARPDLGAAGRLLTAAGPGWWSSSAPPGALCIDGSRSRSGRARPGGARRRDRGRRLLQRRPDRRPAARPAAARGGGPRLRHRRPVHRRPRRDGQLPDLATAQALARTATISTQRST